MCAHLCMLHICAPSSVTYARSCSDRIISAGEHFAPPKLIHSSSFVLTAYSCHRSQRQAVLLSNWMQLLPCCILMTNSEQRKGFFRFVIFFNYLFLFWHIIKGFKSCNLLWFFQLQDSKQSLSTSCFASLSICHRGPSVSEKEGADRHLGQISSAAQINNRESRNINIGYIKKIFCFLSL